MTSLDSHTFKGDGKPLSSTQSQESKNEQQDSQTEKYSYGRLSDEGTTSASAEQGVLKRKLSNVEVGADDDHRQEIWVRNKKLARLDKIERKVVKRNGETHGEVTVGNRKESIFHRKKILGGRAYEAANWYNSLSEQRGSLPLKCWWQKPCS